MNERQASLSRWAGPLVVVVAAAIMLAWTWRQWPDPLVDFGIQLYTPWQLSEGRVLYRDVASLYGPFSSYFNAGLFWAFGASLTVLIWANFVLFLGLLGMLYRIGDAMAGRAAATAGCLLVVLLCGFGQYTGGGNYEFMCPYSHEATHGLMLAVGVVYAWLQFARGGGRGGGMRCVALAGLLTGAAALTKPEPSLAAAVAAAAGWAALVWGDPKHRGAAWRAAALILACAALPVLAAIGLFCLNLPPAEAVHAALNGWTSAFNPALRNMPAYQEWMGTAHFGQHIGELAKATAWYAAAIATGIAAAWAVGNLRKGKIPTSIALGIAIALILWRWRLTFFTFGLARPLPIALAVTAATMAVTLWRRRGDATATERLRWLFIAFAAVYLLRIEFNARVWHFGFVLTVPAMMCLAAALLAWIPRWLDRFKPFAGCGFQGVMLGLLVLTVAAHLRITAYEHGKKTTIVTGGDPGDWFYTDDRGLVVNAAVKTLDARLSPTQTLSVFPESVMLNYLARRAAPNRFIHFEPSELAAFGEDNMLAAFTAHPPDAVVLQQADSREFGFRYFGQDYAHSLWAFLMAGYEPMGPPLGAKPFNPEGEFGMELLRRKVSAATSR